MREEKKKLRRMGGQQRKADSGWERIEGGRRPSGDRGGVRGKEEE